VTACVGQPLLSPVTGGQTSAIYLFQSDKAVQQVTGDQQFGNLAVQALNIATGTQSPAAIVPTTIGMAFPSPEGVRVIDFSGTIGQPIGEAGTGVTLPFINAADPTRVTGAANGDVIRFAVQNGQQIAAPWVEWWHDLARKVWSGPHTLQTSYMASYGSTFITAAQDVPAQIYKSPSQVSGVVDYEEDGSTLTWEAETVLLPDTEAMLANVVNQTTVGLLLPSDQPVTVQAVDEGGTVLDSTVIPGAYTMPLWGGPNVWGTGFWYAQQGFFRQERVPWHNGLTFKQARFKISGVARFGLALGSLRLKYQRLGYLDSDWPYVSLDISVPPLPDAPIINTYPQALVVNRTATRFTPIGAFLIQQAHHGLARNDAQLTLEFNQNDGFILGEYDSSTITGNTHGTTTIDGFSSSVLTEGWLPGHVIGDTEGSIPPGTYIVSINPAGTSVTLSQPARTSLVMTTFVVGGTNLYTNWTSALPPQKLIGQVQAVAGGVLTSYWPFIVTVTP